MMETFLFSSPKFLSYAYIILAPDDTFDLGTIANVGIPADTSMSCGFRGRSSNVNFRNITHTAKAVPKICLDKLSPEERELINRIYFLGYSLRQLSVETGIPYMTIQHRKVKILAKLKKLMES